MLQFGLPYKGSKSGIAPQIVDHLPKATVFVDLFAGGCAVTHAAMLSGKYQLFLMNDITDSPQLFMDAIAGKYRDEKRWISREDFFALKDTDPYVRIVWSFGNNCQDYLYSKEIEPYKKAMHYAVVFDDWTDMERLCPEVTPAARRAVEGVTGNMERRVAMQKAIVRELKTADGTDNPYYDTVVRNTKKHRSECESLERLQRLQQCESLERLQRLQQCESLERLQRLQLDYREVPIPPDSVVYADPPYGKATGYGMTFDTDAFWQWVRERQFPVYVSEYDAPDDFKVVWGRMKTVSQSATATGKAAEKLFLHERFVPGGVLF